MHAMMVFVVRKYMKALENILLTINRIIFKEYEYEYIKIKFCKTLKEIKNREKKYFP